MPSPTVTIASSYIHHMASFVPPGTVTTWLQMSGLRAADLDDAAITLPLDTLTAILSNAAEMANEPALGLFLGQRLVTRTHGFVGYAAIHARSLRELLTVLEAYLPVRVSVLQLTHSVQRDELRLALTSTVPLGDIERPLFEAALMSVHNVLAAISLGAFDVRALCFPFGEPGYGDIARDVANTEVRYDAGWAGLLVRATDLDIPLRTADPAVFEDAALICQRRLEELEAKTSFADRIRRMLYRSENGFPSMQTTAHRLHMTARTLHRRLVDEGTSYRRLVDEVRFRLASDYLASGRASLDELSFMLGYTDPANFRRAFRRWAGMPPSEWRAQHAEE